MFERIAIRSFKSLENVEFELGNVNVFIGPNGSGKSNFLEALGVLSAAANGRVDDEALLRRGVRPGVPALYKCAFPGTVNAPHIYLGVWNSRASYEVSLFNPVKNPSPVWHYHTESWKKAGETTPIAGRSHRTKTKLNPESGLAALKAVNLQTDDPALHFLKDLRDYVIFAPTTPVLRGIAPDSQQRIPVGVSGGRLPDAVADLLKHSRKNEFAARVSVEALSLIEWAKFFGAGDASKLPLSPSVGTTQRVIRFGDRFMKTGRNILSGYDASEGALYLLFHAVLAAHPGTPAVFAVDNADHGLNPRLARELFALVCDWYLQAPSPRQVFLTTHNPLTLDGLPFRDDRVRLFTVSRSEKGRTIVRRIEMNPKLEKMAREGWTLSRLWVMGHLGGIANV